MGRRLDEPIALNSHPDDSERHRSALDGELTSYRMETARQYIHDNSHRNVAIEEIASQVRLSPSRFCHLFKASFGLPAGQYIRQVKLEAARKMLENGLLSIKEISARVGISDPSYFSRMFKDAYGQSPSEYRATHLRERRQNRRKRNA